MILTLDAQTEQRIQREIDLGHYREPAEVINRALDLLQAEQSWSAEGIAYLDQRLTESLAQVQRGETYSGEEARRILAERCLQRAG